jgi:hypothetical protein
MEYSFSKEEVKSIEFEMDRHTCQIFHLDDGNYKPYASGVLISINEIFFLITAAHVTEDWSDSNKFYIRLGFVFIPLAGKLISSDLKISGNIDLSYIIIDKKLIPSIQKIHKFLPIGKINYHGNLIKDVEYCITGYPEKSIKKIKGNTAHLMQTLYVKKSKNNVYVKYGFNPDEFYIFDVFGKGYETFTGKKYKVDTHFNGMSGCGLWHLIPIKRNNVISLDYRLIGIMTEFRNAKYFCMIGIQIKILISIINQIEDLNLKIYKGDI